MIVIVAVAQVGSLFSSDAWNNVTFTAGEVKNPSRNLPLSLALGTGVVIALYIAANFVYLSVLPLAGDPARNFSIRAGYPVCSGRSRWHGGHAGMLPVGRRHAHGACHPDLHLRLRQWTDPRRRARLLRDGQGWPVLPQSGTLHPKYKTPTISLFVQCAWTCILCLSGTYGQLLDYIIFAVLVFYILTIIGLFVLRRTQPNAHRPYRAIGYPVLPAIYIVMALFIDVVLLRYKPQYTWPGLDHRSVRHSGVLPVVAPDGAAFAA